MWFYLSLTTFIQGTLSANLLVAPKGEVISQTGFLVIILIACLVDLLVLVWTKTKLYLWLYSS